MAMRVLVWVERAADGLTRPSLEAVAAAQGLVANGSEAGMALTLAGVDLSPIVDRLNLAQVECLWSLDAPGLTPYNAEAMIGQLQPLVEQQQPDLVLMPHTYRVRDFAPALAARFERSLVAGCSAIHWGTDGLRLMRPLFQGRAEAAVTLRVEPPQFVSLQAGSFDASTISRSETPPPLHAFQVDPPTAPQTRSEPPLRLGEREVDLSRAEIIVAVGRGIQGEAQIALARQLADLLGGELAATRPVCDEGWLPPDRQVGSSGQSVAPKLYLALGISGAIQHQVGMKGSQTIVAINRDPNAPIFSIADYGIVADLFEVVPALIHALKERG